MDLILRLSGWKSTLLNTFWTPQQTALIHLGPPHVGSLREIIAPTGSAEHVAELCGLPTADEQSSRARLQPRLDSLVSKTDQPIASFPQGGGLTPVRAALSFDACSFEGRSELLQADCAICLQPQALPMGVEELLAQSKERLAGLVEPINGGIGEDVSYDELFDAMKVESDKLYRGRRREAPTGSLMMQ